MTLEDFVNVIDDVDEDMIIFQKDNLSIGAEVALFDGEDNVNGVLIKNGVRYVYLLEVFIAKEFINDYVNSLAVKPGSAEIALRLFQYAINDA
ncbi:hypothetical protein [Mucilaginibacter gotjawali]|uniref:L-cysteine desulfidase n=2 Tax=Mucilaginibacter gotjawali TaxID=1550579 RepID=A0A839SGI4_9SPHI|nr:hypothetical protein [Mucilaginibacter gotjawali]MBB3057401.1 L-cysteine desulfidase [Mucilaginibacter gotjawali]BAU55480.1 hypothetical protein MgSA37_03669 [Mucilaginibacter gotjawali]